MPATQVGVLKGASGRIYAVIVPDDDRQLNRPSYQAIFTPADGEEVSMTRISRADYDACQSPDDLAQLVGGVF